MYSPSSSLSVHPKHTNLEVRLNSQKIRKRENGTCFRVFAVFRIGARAGKYGAVVGFMEES